MFICWKKLKVWRKFVVWKKSWEFMCVEQIWMWCDGKLGIWGWTKHTRPWGSFFSTDIIFNARTDGAHASVDRGGRLPHKSCCSSHATRSPLPPLSIHPSNHPWDHPWSIRVVRTQPQSRGRRCSFPPFLASLFFSLSSSPARSVSIARLAPATFVLFSSFHSAPSKGALFFYLLSTPHQPKACKLAQHIRAGSQTQAGRINGCNQRPKQAKRSNLWCRRCR